MDNEAVDCRGEQLIEDEYRHPLKILHTKLIHAVVDYSRNKNLAFDIDVPHLKKHLLGSQAVEQECLTR